MKAPIEWAKLLPKIYESKEIECPYCKSKDVKVDLYAENNVGCAQFHCNKCGEETHLSRVRFPNNVVTKKLYN